ncbi:MAG TPA: hypothetical protein DCX80_05550, partial [Chloroflexi bacterium]|nr:hypothetical protein [Chloroflexota bacterium]
MRAPGSPARDRRYSRTSREPVHPCEHCTERRPGCAVIASEKRRHAKEDDERVSICGVIFDLDGTLADTLPVCCAAFRPVLLDITGREYNDSEIVALFGPNEEGILRRLAGDDWPAAMERFLAEYEANHDTCPAPFEGIDDVLRRI